MKKNILQLSIKSIEKSSSLYLFFIKRLLDKLEIKNTIIKMPKIVKRVTLLKSPHVNKKSREQFQVSYYKFIVNVYTFKEKFNKNFLKFVILNKPKYISLSLRRII